MCKGHPVGLGCRGAPLSPEGGPALGPRHQHPHPRRDAGSSSRPSPRHTQRHTKEPHWLQSRHSALRRALQPRCRFAHHRGARIPSSTRARAHTHAPVVPHSFRRERHRGTRVAECAGGLSRYPTPSRRGTSPRPAPGPGVAWAIGPQSGPPPPPGNTEPHSSVPGTTGQVMGGIPGASPGALCQPWVVSPCQQ